jgi:hypothetical protein
MLYGGVHKQETVMIPCQRDQFAIPHEVAAAKVYARTLGDSTRIAPHVYNTGADVERLFTAAQNTVAPSGRAR